MVVTTIKLTVVFYNDLQQQSSSDKGASSLPFDDIRYQKDLKTRMINSIGDPAGPLLSTLAPINRTMIDEYRRYVQSTNREQHMYNSNLFSPNTTRYILLVQVHTRVVYLKKFIEMLKAVRTIEQTLLIFSHDYIDADINALVTNITFVPVGCFAFAWQSGVDSNTRDEFRSAFVEVYKERRVVRSVTHIWPEYCKALSQYCHRFVSCGKGREISSHRTSTLFVWTDSSATFRSLDMHFEKLGV